MSSVAKDDSSLKVLELSSDDEDTLDAEIREMAASRPLPAKVAAKRKSSVKAVSAKKSRVITDDDSETTIDAEPSSAQPPKAAKPLVVKKPRTPANAYVPLDELSVDSIVRTVGFIDVGSRNMAMLTYNVHEQRLMHAKVFDVHELCKDYEAANPLVKLNTSSDKSESPVYTKDALQEALRWFMVENSTGGRCFDLDMLIVEQQAYDGLMMSLEVVLISTFNQLRPPVHIIDGMRGTAVAAARSQNATAVKTLYRNCFPLADNRYVTPNQHPKAARFAPGRGGKRTLRETGVQHSRNKKGAVKAGSLMIRVDRFLDLVDPRFVTDRDRARLRKRKLDDLYDTLMMLWRFVAADLWQFRHIKHRGTHAPRSAFRTLPPRPGSNFEELIDLCGAFGTEPTEIHALMELVSGSKLDPTAFGLEVDSDDATE